jgi:hypothetical protein
MYYSFGNIRVLCCVVLCCVALCCMLPCVVCCVVLCCVCCVVLCCVSCGAGNDLDFSSSGFSRTNSSP